MTFCKQEAQFERTGEKRCPVKGEWFLGGNGRPSQAMFDFRNSPLPILKKIEPEAQKESAEGDLKI